MDFFSNISFSSKLFYRLLKRWYQWTNGKTTHSPVFLHIPIVFLFFFLPYLPFYSRRKTPWGEGIFDHLGIFDRGGGGGGGGGGIFLKTILPNLTFWVLFIEWAVRSSPASAFLPKYFPFEIFDRFFQTF